jgi:hypothetical protein
MVVVLPAVIIRVNVLQPSSGDSEKTVPVVAECRVARVETHADSPIKPLEDPLEFIGMTADEVRQRALDREDHLHVLARPPQDLQGFRTVREPLLNIRRVARDVAGVHDDDRASKVAERRGGREHRTDRCMTMVGIRVAEIQQPAERRVNRDGRDRMAIEPVPNGRYFCLPPRIEMAWRRADFHTANLPVL